MSFKATVRTLGSPAIMGVSAWLRLYVAFLLIAMRPDKILCFAFSFIVYSVYAFDRALKSKEDEINRPEEQNANRKVVLFVVFSLLSASMIILYIKKLSPFIALIPFIIGFLYTKGIKIGKLSIRLKGGFGIKNIVVAFTWASTISAFVYTFAEGYLQIFLIFIFFFFKSFIITVILDCGDIKGDSIAGLKTLPVCLGEQKTRWMLKFIHTFAHLFLILIVAFNIIKFEIIILAYSFLAGITYISIYTNTKRTILRRPFIQGEWIPLILARYII